MGLSNEVTKSIVLQTKFLITSQVEDEELWPILFLLASGVTLVTCVVYLLLGSAETQDWDSISESQVDLFDEKQQTGEKNCKVKVCINEI